MDATENEHPAMPVTGFPTLKLFKPNNRTPVDYSGDRSLNDMIKFLEENANLNLTQTADVTSEEL